MSDILAKILTEPGLTLGMRAIDGVLGLESAQVVQVLVREDGQESEYICVNCAAVQPTPRQCRLLTAALKPVFPGATVAILKWEGKPGAEDVYLAPGQPGTPTGCAAAFSAYKMSWGWDESPTFAIRVNGEEIVLSVEWFDGEWRPFRKPARRHHRRTALMGLTAWMRDTFMSRNNDFEGYWVPGQLYRAVENFPEKKFVVDFLDGAFAPDTDITQKISRKYPDFLWRMLNRQGIPAVWIQSATVTCVFGVEKPGDDRKDWSGGPGGFYDCVAEIVDNRGRAYRMAREGWCWPHDPKREYRRVV